MGFPINLTINLGIINSGSYNIKLNSGLTTLVGPNGSGKTQILRAIKQGIVQFSNGKKVRLMSAGRIGLFEQFRSDFDGYRGAGLNYDSANFGSKSDVNRRHNAETINGDYQTLSVRPDILIKVQERLRKLFNRNLFIEWDGGDLKVLFSRLDTFGGPYSSAREASGLIHLVAILAAIYDDEVGVLLLDEPEVSLHPQLQAFLLKEIKRYSGEPSKTGKKIIIVATHSTELIDLNRAEDLPNLVFCYDIYKNPVQIDTAAGELKNNKIKELVSRMGQEHKLSLFCKKPLLVEGPSDVIVCSGIDRNLDLFLEAAGTQLLPVIGKGQIPIVVKFMNLIGKCPIVLTDADSFCDDLSLIYTYTNTETANELALEYGFPNGNIFAKGIYDDFCSIVEKRWDSISEHAQKHAYWINGDKDNALQKIKRRAVFSTLFNLGDEELDKVQFSLEWKAIKKRLAVLLDFLESVGCFVLRKGTIEAYYKHSDKLTSQEKPSAAVVEVENMQGLTQEEIKEYYSDIYRCLEFSSKKEVINETEAIRELLLSLIGPIIVQLDKDITKEKINSITRNILGERSKLFDIDVEKNDTKKIELVIGLNSNIMDIDRFPIRISKDDNLISTVNNKLGLE